MIPAPSAALGAAQRTSRALPWVGGGGGRSVEAKGRCLRAWFRGLEPATPLHARTGSFFHLEKLSRCVPRHLASCALPVPQELVESSPVLLSAFSPGFSLPRGGVGGAHPAPRRECLWFILVFIYSFLLSRARGACRRSSVQSRACVCDW